MEFIDRKYIRDYNRHKLDVSNLRKEHDDDTIYTFIILPSFHVSWH